jgi:hypothetical protein
MANKKSRVGIGLVAAGAAFGVAAMMSGATAPTARADDYTEISYAVNEAFGFGQTAFTTAASDFGSSDLPGGLAAFFNGVDDDFLSAPNVVISGAVEALSGEPINYGAADWTISPEPNFAEGVSDAQYFFNIGQGEFSTAISDLFSGDYGGAAYFDASGFDFTAVIPLEEVLLGAAASL